MEFIPFGAADKIKLSVALVQNTVCIPTKTGKVCTARDALRFMMLCQAQRLNPYAGDCYLCGYDGKNGPAFSLITAHQAFLKRAETCQDYEGMESGVILCNDDSVITEREGDFVLESEHCVGGWARVHRKGRKPTYRRTSIAAMRPPYETPFWENRFKAAAQIVKCAEADALRSTFPTLLGGLYSGDELNMNATISASGVIDIPSNLPAALPETTQTITTGNEVQREKVTPQSELEALVTGEGFTFDHMQKFGIESGNINNAESVAMFAEITTEEAKRLLKAKTGLLAALKTIKGNQ